MINKEELFDVIKFKGVPFEVIRRKINDKFVMERPYYFPHDNIVNTFSNYSNEIINGNDCWTITQLSGLDEDSSIALELHANPNLIRLVISAQTFTEIAEKVILEKEIYLERNVDEFLNNLPSLIEHYHKVLAVGHHDYCQREYIKNRDTIKRKTKASIKKFSDDVVEKSIHPLELR